MLHFSNTTVAISKFSRVPNGTLFQNITNEGNVFFFPFLQRYSKTYKNHGFILLFERNFTVMICQSISYDDKSILREVVRQAKGLIEGLATASDKDERSSVLKLSLIAFDHNVVNVHDQMVESGAVTVLIRCLQRAIFGGEDELLQVDPICQLLLMNYRCSKEKAIESLTKSGAELFSVMFSVMCQSKSFPAYETPSSVIALTRQLTDTGLEINLRLMTASAQLLRIIRQILEECAIETDRAFLVEVVRILSGLTLHSESKAIVLNFPGLFQSFVVKVSDCYLPRCKLNLEAVKLLRNLAWDPRSKSVMANNKACVRLLVMLCGDENTATRLGAICTLKFLAYEGKSRANLFYNGKVKLVHTLVRATESQRLMQGATETMMNLVCRDTALLICKQSSVVPTLRSIALNKANGKSSIVAAQTLKRLATYVPVSGQGALLHALLHLSTADSYPVKHWISKAFVEQSKMPGSSFFIVRMPQIISIITQLARDKHPAVKASAMEALQNLAAQTVNVKRLAVNSELLEVFIHNVEGRGLVDGEASTATRRHAVQALLSLASHRCTKKRVAKQQGLVASLSRYGTSQDNDAELKRAALHGVLLLAPLM